MKHYDVAIIGAGAAGLSAAAVALRNGRRVLVLDMGDTPARKVAASGGGRCNFTNAAAGINRYFGENPNFIRGALARVTPHDILDWMSEHNLAWTEKEPGRYFCQTGASDVVRALLNDARGADIRTGITVHDVRRGNNDGFVVDSSAGEFYAARVIIATGGMSFGAYGVSDVGYKIAKRFGHKIVPPRPALCPIVTPIFGPDFAGMSTPVQISIAGRTVSGNMLFTHFGIGGPAVYSASIAPTGHDIHINFAPDCDMTVWIRGQKRENGRKTLAKILSTIMPTQLARYFGAGTCNIADMRDTELLDIAHHINDFVIPAASWRHHGVTAAEVTSGGIATSDISSKTMESKLCPGLFFTGEVIDITGDLGGFNLHWAFASGRVAGANV